MIHSARLVVKGVWGIPNPPAFARNLLAADEWKQARARGAIENLKKLRGVDYDASGNELTRSGSSHKDTAALMLNYTNLYEESRNALPGGIDEKFRAVAKLFGGGPGIVFTDGTPGTVAELPGPSLEDNESWSIQFYLHEPDEEALKALSLLPIFAIRWGANVGPTKGYWQFRLIGGQAQLMRLKAAWTQEQEDDLMALLALEDPTIDETDQATALDKLIHENVSHVSVGPGRIYNQIIDLTFFAERRGAVTIDESGYERDYVEVPDVLAKREAGTIWPASALKVWCNTGIFALKWGRPQHKKTGVIRLGTYIPYANFDFGLASFGGTWDAPDGTEVELGYDSGDPGDTAHYNPNLGIDERETILILRGDGTKTPFVYAAQVYSEGGERDGSDVTVWDSDNHPYCIREIDPQLEGGGVGPIARRTNYRVRLRAYHTDTDHGAFGANYNLLSNDFRFENHVCDLYIDGVKRVGNGIILGSAFVDAKSADEAVPGTLLSDDALWDWTDLELDISDKLALADESLFVNDSPLGDGQHSGKHLRSILKGMGERDAEIGFTNTDGAVIESAGLGEKFVALPDSYDSRGSYMPDLMRDHDPNRQIGVDNEGIWQMTPYPYSIEHRTDGNGDLINFQSGSRNDPYTEPGRYAILKRFEMTRDFSRVFNLFTSIGAEDENDVPITRTWTEWPSIQSGAQHPDFTYLGRIKAMRPVRNSGWRTRLPVERNVRRQAAENMRSGWIFVFETYFHGHLYPGDRVYCAGWDSEIIRVLSGSWRDDRMVMALLIFNSRMGA